MFGGDLENLIEDIQNNPQSSITQIPLAQIRPNPYQPRRVFDEESLKELSQSIAAHGVFTPVLLKESLSGYEIVAGERRVRAAKMAGLTEIPAILVSFSDDEMMEIALLENIQREDLNAIEEARAYQTLMDQLGLTQEELASRLGKSRAHIANTLRLLKLPSKLQEAVLDNRLSMGHVRPLITLSEKDALEIGEKAINNHLSVRDVEKLAQNLSTKKKSAPPSVDEHYSYAEKLLRDKYRTSVKIHDKKIVLSFTDDDDLNRLLELFDVLEDV